MKLLYAIRLSPIMLLAVALFVSGCADDGAPGPAGPTGPSGPAGPTGATGPAGATGTANVIYGEWFKPESYKSESVFGIQYFTHNHAVPAITQEILDTGVVLVYAKLLGYNSIVWPVTQVGQLPINITYMQGGLQSDTWSGYPSVGNIKIQFTNSNNIYTSISTAHVFRYVIIPGGVADAGGRVAPLDSEYITRLKSLSYADAMAELGIPE
jgi:hypothetical protein